MALSKNFWNNYFEVYDVLNLVIPYQKLLDKVIGSLNIQAGQKILDAGCGTGNLSLKIMEEYRDVEVFGLDSSTEALKRFKTKAPNANVSSHDLTKKLPFRDNYFDRIACVNVFYALPEEDRGKVLQEFRRVLKKGGIFVMTNPIDKNPSKIYIEHVKAEYELNNFLRATLKVLVFIPATLKMLYYNSKIVNTLSHTFLSQAEQKKLLEEARFKTISFARVYSDQSLEAVAENLGD